MQFSLLNFAQSSVDYGLIPSINLNKKLGNHWKLNLKSESRFDFMSDTPTGTYLLSDFGLVLAHSLSMNGAVAGGYQVRIKDGGLIHRSIQQFSWVKKINGVKLGHRLVTDQTFQSTSAPHYRFRYRIAAQLALKGQRVDKREFYLKLNHEYLNSLKGGSYDLEVRLVPLLGFAIADNNKLETGIDYRLKGFAGNTIRQNAWFRLTWYIAL